MSIRIRVVEGVTVALCGYETDEKEGDIYLDDAAHYALAAKFRRDWAGQINDITYPEEWAAMDTQKLRCAEERTDLDKSCDCSDKSQCWEPCGDLGKDESSVRRSPLNDDEEFQRGLRNVFSKLASEQTSLGAEFHAAMGNISELYVYDD